MTYSKDWRAYPPSFAPLVERAVLQEVSIPCASDKDARRLQGKLHAYFGVLHKNAASNPELIPLDNMCRKVQVKLGPGFTVVARPRDQEEDNLLVMQVLEGLDSAPAMGADSVPMSAEMREMFAGVVDKTK